MLSWRRNNNKGLANRIYKRYVWHCCRFISDEWNNIFKIISVMVIISPGQYYPSPDFDFPPGSSIAPLIVEARCIDYIQLNIDKIIILKESSLCLPNHNKVNLQSTFSHTFYFWIPLITIYTPEILLFFCQFANLNLPEKGNFIDRSQDGSRVGLFKRLYSAWYVNNTLIFPRCLPSVHCIQISIGSLLQTVAQAYVMMSTAVIVALSLRSRWVDCGN